MKIPPAQLEKALPASAATATERDRSFLIFAGAVLVAVALGFQSAPGAVWPLAFGLVLVGAPAILGYLRGGAEEFPRIEHYFPVALGAITLAGLSQQQLIPERWKYLALTVVFGVGFVIAARLDYLRLRDAEKRGHLILQEVILILAFTGAMWVIVESHFNPILQLFWIFAIAFMASYRSFRINGIAIPPRRALIFSVFVAQVVTFLAWAITSLELYLQIDENIFTVMLLLAWYINRGLVRHTVEDSFTRNVVLEYGAFGVVLVYLFVSSYQPGR